MATTSLQKSSLSDCRAEWFDDSWWAKEIARVIALPNPTLCNLHITFAHYRLSLALHAVTGANSGANFHTWAVWGSKKAGVTIRQEDTRRVRRTINLVGGGCGLGVAASGFGGLALLNPALGLGLGCLIGVGPALSARRVLSKTTSQVLAGNRTVLEDIGTATSRFVAAFHNCTAPDADRLEKFLQTLRPGRTESGGQSLLSRAFTHYYNARYESDQDKKHEWMLLANCYAILHEHIRLEPYISSAMPILFRRWITARLLNFHIGEDELRVGLDVPNEEGQSFPETLREIENPELLAFLEGEEGWDRTPDSLAGSRARDWANLRERMNFIVDLFRSRHLNPKLFAAPYTGEQCEELMEGRIPSGPL